MHRFLAILCIGSLASGCAAIVAPYQIQDADWVETRMDEGMEGRIAPSDVPDTQINAQDVAELDRQQVLVLERLLELEALKAEAETDEELNVEEFVEAAKARLTPPS